MAAPHNTIAFQGFHGAYSEMSCKAVFPDMTTLPCPSFEDAFKAVHDGKAKLAMIPIDNSVAGRVADIHHLLPGSNLHIIGEHFERIDHHLLGIQDTDVSQLKEVHSHVHALNQCRDLIRALGLKAVVHADTAGAAEMVAERQDPTIAAIASQLAGEINGLQSLRTNIEDAEHNTTRFLIMGAEDTRPDPSEDNLMTSFVFRVRSVPAALFKALGGFATNGVNMTKLESYLIGGSFQAAQFYCEVDGHPEQQALKLALEELDFFTEEVKVMGVYPMSGFRAL